MSALAALLTFALAAWLLIGEPLYGRRSHRRMLAALDAGQAGARQRFYLQWTLLAWLLAAVTLAVAWFDGWGMARLGLRLPSMAALPSGPSHGFLGGLLVGWGIALLAGLAVGLLLARRRKPKPEPPAPARVIGSGAVLRMLPRSAPERRAFAMLAITAGITEELVWRGFGRAALHAALPALPAAAALVVLALAFGWAHVYQGWAGVLATAVIGGLLGWLYLATGSLLPPMLLHALIDLRALLVRVPGASAEPPAREPHH